MSLKELLGKLNEEELKEIIRNGGDLAALKQALGSDTVEALLDTTRRANLDPRCDELIYAKYLLRDLKEAIKSRLSPCNWLCSIICFH